MSTPRRFAGRAHARRAPTTALVLVTCAVIGVWCLATLRSTSAELDPLTARATGTVAAVNGDSVTARWTATGKPATADVVLAVTPPKVGTAIEVAYDPKDPRHAVIPHAAIFDRISRAATGIGLALAFAGLVLTVDIWLLVTRVRLDRRQARRITVRRVRVQRGLLTRSWLETDDEPHREPHRWFPVYFDAALVELPTPSEVDVYGDPKRDRLLSFRITDRIMLYPSGRAVDVHPRGRRSDNPAKPDSDAGAHAAVSARLRRQLRADAASTVPAPLIGVGWAFVDGSGFIGWLAATAITATLSLWWAAVRGSDPS